MSMTANDRQAALAEAGAWLREQRKRAGYDKLGDFARDLKVDPSRVSQYENGKAAVPDERAEDIARLLDLDLIYTRSNLGLWVPDLPEDDFEIAARAEQHLDAAEAELDRIMADPELRANLRRILASPKKAAEFEFAVRLIGRDRTDEDDAEDEQQRRSG